MASIPGIVDVSITRNALSLTQANFGTLLIVGENGTFSSERVRTYNTLVDVAADFLSSDIEYLLAADYFAQSPSPTQVKIGIYAPVQYVGEFSFAGTLASGTLQADINGQTVSAAFNTDLDTTVGDLAAAIALLADVATAEASGAVGTGDLKITITATEGYSITVTNVVVPGTVTDSTFATTIVGETYNDALNEILLADSGFYGVVLGSRLVKDWDAASTFVLANSRILFTASNDSDYLDSAVTDDWMSLQKAASNNRLVALYSGDTGNYIEAAFPGVEFTKDPGSYTMKFKTFTGISVDSLTPSQKLAVLNKNGNAYTTVGGKNILENGKTASGVAVDSVRGQDWLAARIMENIYLALTSVDKVPFSDAGITLIENTVREIMEAGVSSGYVAAGYTVSLPTLAEIPSADRLARELNDVSFSYNEQGAIEKVSVAGVNNG